MANRSSNIPQMKPRSMRLSTACLCIALAFVAGMLAGTMLHDIQQTPAQQSTTTNATPQVSTEQHIQQIEIQLKTNPNDASLWFHLGDECYDARIPDKAIKAYLRGLALQPDNVNARTDLGTMYRMTGQFELALSQYNDVIARDPRHRNARFNKGIVLFYDLGRKQEALNAWKALVSVLPDAKAPDGQPMTEFITQHEAQ